MAMALSSFTQASHIPLHLARLVAGSTMEATTSSSHFFLHSTPLAPPTSTPPLHSRRCKLPSVHLLRAPASQEPSCSSRAGPRARSASSKDGVLLTELERFPQGPEASQANPSVNVQDLAIELRTLEANETNPSCKVREAAFELRTEQANGIRTLNGTATAAASARAPIAVENQTSMVRDLLNLNVELFDEEQKIEQGTSNLSEGEDEILSPVALKREISRRRNFAIISHPDAGKTTFTEKLLLYGGAIHQAGAVKARRAARHATSDWMELEKQRGISITSTALVFDTNGFHITLLDTPGHQDFGEDTYRTLAAADNAVMLVDAGKGLEPQTRKLFEVCRLRKLPLFTFINKLDRPALQPLDLLDQIEKEFGLLTHPVSWPIGSGDRFVGVYYRPRKEVHLFEKDKSHGSREASVRIMSWEDPALKHCIARDLYEQLQEEIELLESLTPPLDKEKLHAGELTPVYFGSAMNNFGVELFLESFLQNSMHPIRHKSDIGDIHPNYPHFTGFIFKLQANMDPKHRDKVAFVRICSGQFSKGMKVTVGRTGKSISLTRPQKMFAQDRSIVETAFAGDVIGLNNPNAFCIGDTIYCGPKLAYPGIPSFSPELFCYMRNQNPSKYKQFQKGISELLGEGAVQVLYSVDSGRADPILAAVGQLQFEVVQYRMLNEYGVDTQLEPLPYSVARWVVGGWPAIEKAGRLYSCANVKDQWGRPVLLFRNEWNLSQLLSDNHDIGDLVAYALPPAEQLSKR